MSLISHLDRVWVTGVGNQRGRESTAAWIIDPSRNVLGIMQPKDSGARAAAFEPGKDDRDAPGAPK